MKNISTVNRIKSFFNEKDKYILQIVENQKNFSKEHKHTFYEIVYVISGVCSHMVNGSVLQMDIGDFIILRPFDSHCFLELSSSAQVLCISVAIDEYEKYEHLWGAVLMGEKGKEPKVCNLPQYTVKIISDLLDAETRDTDSRVRAVCSILFSSFSDIFNGEKRISRNSLDDMLEKMSCNLSLQNSGLQAMLSLSGYSVSQLTRVMKKKYGITPHEYLKDLRLSTARRLVVETDISLEAISYECGYKCYGYFTNVFKEKYGLTPAVLRKTVNL